MTRTLPILLTVIALAALPAFVLAADPEEEIRTLVVEFNESYLQNELDKYFSFYADDATLWFNSGRSTLKSYRDSWYELIESGGGVRKNAISDIRIQMSPAGDAAIATYQVEVQTEYPGNRLSSQQANETDIWFKTADGWRISHVHYTSSSGEE
ncbi:MAG: nuclear transport factor 2 family protein [Woeseia sp.]